MEALCDCCAYFCDRNRYTDGFECYIGVVGGGAGHWIRTFSVAVRAGLSLHRNCDVRIGVFPSHLLVGTQEKPCKSRTRSARRFAPRQQKYKVRRKPDFVFLVAGAGLAPATSRL